MAGPITLQQLIDAGVDAATLAAFANGNPQIVTPRYGPQYPNASKVSADAQAAYQSAINILRTYTPRGNWAAGTSYAVRDIVVNGGVVYAAALAHTAGGNFNADLAAGRWFVLQGVTAAELANQNDPALGAGLVGYKGQTLAEYLDFLERMPVYAAYVAEMRPVLRREYGTGPSRRATKSFRDVAHATYTHCRKVTSTGITTLVPDGNNAYGASWIRDMSMGIRCAPEFMTDSELYNAFKWYFGKCEVGVSGRYRVPDHVALDGTIYWTPGYDNNWGTRAPTDGEPMLVGLAWAHYMKSGSTQLYEENGADLKTLMDHLPTDATTKCVYVPALPGFVTWGFIDTVGLQGSVLFGSLLNFIAYRQLADMAWAAGDYATAGDCIERAMAIKEGINSPAADLWRGVAFPDEAGFYRFSNGSASSNVLDVWGSALAVFCDAATTQRARAISINLAANFDLKYPGNGLPEYLDRGGIRHTLRSTDYQPGTKMWQFAWDGSPLNSTDGYQHGAYWMTPLHWAAFALGLTRQDLVGELIYRVLGEVSFEDRPGQTTVPNEWVTSAGAYGVSDYMTSAAALLALPSVEADYRLGAVTRLGQSNPQTFPAGAFTKVTFDTITALDDLRGAAVATNEIIIPADGKYRVAAAMYFEAGAIPNGGAFDFGIQINGAAADKLQVGSAPNGMSFSCRGAVEVRLFKGQKVGIRLFLANGGTNTIVAESYTFFQVSPAS